MKVEDSELEQSPSSAILLTRESKFASCESSSTLHLAHLKFNRVENQDSVFAFLKVLRELVLVLVVAISSK